MTVPVLVTGGAGYIGSHVVLALIEAGYAPVVLDDLSTGHVAALCEGTKFVEGSVADMALVRRLLVEERIEAVLHFAGSIVVPDSVADPLAYYRNNSLASHGLIAAAIAAGVGGFLFSSTAAIYGNAAEQPITEEGPANPENPYGRSKLVTEWMLADAGRAHGLGWRALRYFNVAGADPLGRAGQRSKRATHLVKVAAETAAGLRDHVVIHGCDYATTDGTCIRDYIHVSDLADAHVVALRHLLSQQGGHALNCGYGHGFSVLEVLDAMDRAAGHAAPRRMGPRRPGDVAALVADSGKLRALGWQPRHDTLDAIVGTALAWERRIVGGG
ncbi:MAG: UDP-glucose 4-epimerase GalE [Alphaproteobacteria bacterium]|nr:UDP-glucose 4-epimerase GalE [Alphaproteobacteria bacterium]